MHQSVLFEEVMHWLQPRAGGQYIDGTLGYGGHTQGILDRSAPDGRVMAFDRDSSAIELARQRLGKHAQRVIFVHDSFEQMRRAATDREFDPVDGIVLDLGLSSMQLDQAQRGFSFRYDAPLDMRFDRSQTTTAATLVNSLDAEQLADIFWRYGEVRNSRRIAQWLIDARPIETTAKLAAIVAQMTPARQRRRIHPATQIFQALRIAVNDELGALERALPQALALLAPGARLAVISFHSLEDRLVKQTTRTWSESCICPPAQPICTCDKEVLVTLPVRKAIKPSPQEVGLNPRSRSARLRVVEKC